MPGRSGQVMRRRAVASMKRLTVPGLLALLFAVLLWSCATGALNIYWQSVIMETVRVDVRVLATTNRKLEEAVAENKFRQDLYYRLNVIPLKLPPLRERGEDVLRLAVFFVDRFRKAYQLSPLAFSPEARQWLLEYDWPGNVRELQNLMSR